MFSTHALEIDARAECDRITSLLAHAVRGTLRRNGAVVGVSGGIDSAVVLALCAKSFGPGRVRAILMPERDSDPESERLARDVAALYGVQCVIEDISVCLHAFGCYRRKDEAIRRIFPEYDAARGYKSKITLPPNLLDESTLDVFSLTIVRPDGEALTERLPSHELLQIVAASNFKQRARMSMLYYNAELNNYAVVGTANKDEHDSGFFVKYGDGGVDVMPIAHLFKTQVYQLADVLGIPEEIRQRVPTTDTYSAPTTQEEFFFRLPFAMMDLLWYAMETGVDAAEAARVMNLSEQQVTRVYESLARRRRATEYLRSHPIGFRDQLTRAEEAPVRAASAPQS
ncbi:MAG TPA: NAD(+) synthase [Bryobacteraceae bacterium]|nr:NAD(+) synthase [Bryobacteraceae bacterium]